MQRLTSKLDLSVIGEEKSTVQIDKSYPKQISCSPFEIWALGITIVIGGDYFSWNEGLLSGFGSFLISTILIGSAYICLILCTSEMLSALPFAGGSYGLARCTLGFFPGFLVGCSEALEYIIYVAISSSTLVSMISSFLGTDKKYQPVYCCLFYLVSNAIHIYGGSVFWKINTLIGVVSILVVVLYCFGALVWVDFKTNVTDSQPFFLGGVGGFFRVLPLPAWFYVGVESLAFACDMVTQGDPKLIVPQGSIACIMTLFATSIWVLFVCCSLPPGTSQLTNENFPFNVGFALIFRCSNTCATILSLPATFATAYGFIFSYGKLLHALAASRLLPELLSRRSETRGTPYTAIIFGSFVSYGVYLLVFFIPKVSHYLFNICMLCAFVAYCSQCIGYWFMKTKYSQISRKFKSPLGKPGSLYAFFVFFFGIISVIGFQEDKQIAFISTIVIWGFLTAFYFIYSKSKQIFSSEEQKILLVAHVINYNVRRGARRHIQKKVKGGENNVSSRSSNDIGGQTSGILSTSVELAGRTSSTALKHPLNLQRSTSNAKLIRVQPTTDSI